MSNIIKSFSDFHNPSPINEGVGDFFSNLFSSAGGAFNDVIKSKILSYLYDFLGVPEGSFLGNVIEKVGQQIDWSEYGDIITGGSIPVDKFAPKLADATFELLTVEGVRPIARKILGENFNTNGLLYRTIEEMITNETKKKEFKEFLTDAWIWALGGGTPGKSNKSTMFQVGAGNKSSKVKNIFDFTPEEKKKIASDPAVKKATREGSLTLDDILSNLSGGELGSGTRGTTTGG